jgi:trk system potassium uptake protein TrkA
MKKQIAVIGLGRFGISLIEELTLLGYEVLAIDNDNDKVNAVANICTHAVQADAMDEQALKSLGIRNFDIVVVSIGENVQANILAVIMLQELGVKRVVAKAKNSLHGKVLEKIGATVIFPERDMGKRLAHMLVSQNIMDHIELSPHYSIMEFRAPELYCGKSLEQLGVRKMMRITILAIKRGDQIIVAPSAGQVIDRGDVLVAVGKNVDLKKLYDMD